MNQNKCSYCRLFGAPKTQTNVILYTGSLLAEIINTINTLNDDKKTDSDLSELKFTTYLDYSERIKHVFEETDASKESKSTQVACCHQPSVLLEYPSEPPKQDELERIIFGGMNSANHDLNMQSGTSKRLGKWYIIIIPYFSQINIWKMFMERKRMNKNTFNYTIIAYFATEARLFENAISNDTTVPEYNNKISKSYENFKEDFFKHWNNFKDLQQNTILVLEDESFNVSRFRDLCESIQKKDRWQIFSADPSAIQNKILFPFRYRALGDENDERKKVRFIYEERYADELQTINCRLNNQYHDVSALRRAMELLHESKRLSKEERRTLKRLFLFPPHEYKIKKYEPLLPTLVTTAIQLLNNNNNNQDCALIYGTNWLICKILSFRNFTRDVKEGAAIYELCSLLINDPVPILKLAGLSLCVFILNLDNTEFEYTIKLLQCDSSLTRKVIDSVHCLLQPYLKFQQHFTEDPVQDRISANDMDTKKKTDAEYLDEYTDMLVFKETTKPLICLFQASTDACSVITKEDVLRISDVLETLISQIPTVPSRVLDNNTRLASHLCCILLPVLEHGTLEINNTLQKELNLTIIIPKLLTSLKSGNSCSTDFECCLSLYNQLVLARYSRLSSRPDSQISVDGQEDILDECIMHSSVENESNMVERTPPIPNIIDKYYKTQGLLHELIGMSHKSIKHEEEEGLFQDGSISDLLVMKDDYEKLETKIKQSTEQLRNLKEEIERTKSEIARHEHNKHEIRQQFYQHISQCMIKQCENVNDIPTCEPIIESVETNEGTMSEFDCLEPADISSEKAKQFIVEIHRRRTTFREHDLRESICGSLKQLGLDLYSSPVHFLHELIQNADDNTYGDNVKPCIRITLDDEYILLSNNERGLRAVDVLAICNLAVSTKTGNQSLGNKGIGFKSVFSASNQPTLISHSWKFRFEVPGADRMSYITPIWIENETALHHIAHQLATYPKDTHIYLPLKWTLHSESSNQFLDNVMKTIDPCILLFLRKIEELHIQDKRTNKIIHMKKEPPITINLNNNGSVNFESQTFEELSGSLVELRESSVPAFFRVYSCTVEIANDLEQQGNSRTQLTLAFPCNKNYKPNASVYAGLPVCDLGFNFMFNADFKLVTNRESIRESVRSNCDLRDKLACFFVYILLNDPEIKKDIHIYCPSLEKLQAIHSSWWKMMIDLINRMIMKHIRRTDKILRYPNPNLEVLVSNEDLSEFANIELIEVNDQFFTEERLGTYGIKHASIVDVLNCFPSQENTQNNTFYDRALRKDESWWTKLFDHLSIDMNLELATKMLSKPIFLLNKNTHRTYLPSFSKTTQLLLYIHEDQSVKVWKKILTMLYYESESERSTLLGTKQIRLLTEKELIKIILLDHLQKANSLQNFKWSDDECQEIWLDLHYLRSRLNKFDCSKPLIIPVQNSSHPRLIKNAFLPTLLGLEIMNIVRDRSCSFVKYPPKNKEVEELTECLHWEYFLLKLNCQVTSIELKKDYTNDELPIFRLFEKCETDERANMAEFILSKQTSLTRENIRLFPVNANVLGEKQLYPLWKTLDVTVEPTLKFLPHIKIIPSLHHLADQLGVCTKTDINMCITILHLLATNKYTNIDLYLKYLSQLELLLCSTTTVFDVEKCKHLHCLYLKDENAFCSFDQLLIMEEPTNKDLVSINKICKYLDLKVISGTKNRIYLGFTKLFRDLRCKFSLTIDDISRAIDHASNDRENFFSVGNGKNILCYQGKELIIELLKLLEHKISETINDTVTRRPSTVCIGSKEDMQWRFRLLNNEKLKQQKYLAEIKLVVHKIVTVEDKMVQIIPSDNIYASFERLIIENLSRPRGFYHFVAPEIVDNCPLVLAILGIDYIERIGALKWNHTNMNPEWEHENLSKDFQQCFGIPEIKVLSSKYVDITLVLQRRIEEERWYSESYPIKTNAEIPLIILGNYVFIFNPKKASSIKSDFIRQALQTLKLRVQHISFEESEGTAIRIFPNDHPYKSTKPHCLNDFMRGSIFQLIDVVFPVNSRYFQSIRVWIGKIDLIGSSTRVTELNAEERSNINEKVRKMCDDRYDRLLLNDRDPVFSTSYIFNSEEQDIICRKAEVYFFNYLKLHYGENLVDPAKNWASTHRSVFHPAYSYHISGSIGYHFMVCDTQEVFVKKEKGIYKTCYFAVKGIKGIFDPRHTTFNITEAEYKQCCGIVKDSTRSKTEAYIIIIIENYHIDRQIGLGKVIYWSDDIDMIDRKPKSYLCKLKTAV